MNGPLVIKSIPVVPAVASNWSAVGIGDIDQSGYSDIILRDQNNDVGIVSFHADGRYTMGKPLKASEFTYPCGGSDGNPAAPKVLPNRPILECREVRRCPRRRLCRHSLGQYDNRPNRDHQLCV